MPSIKNPDSIQSLSSPAPSSVPSSSVTVSTKRSVCWRDPHLVQARFELVDLGLLDEYVLFIQLLDDVFVVVLAVDIDQHGFDGRVALDKRACGGLASRTGEMKASTTSDCLDHREDCIEDVGGGWPS